MAAVRKPSLGEFFPVSDDEIVVVDNWKKIVETNMRIDGYIVAGEREVLNVGDVIKGSWDPVPWRVIGKATYADALRQFKRLTILAGADEDAVPPPSDMLWYKVVVAD